MTLREIQEEIISEFNVFDDWMDKYEYIIDLGKELPLIEPTKKTDDRLIDGCQSKVWLDATVVNGKMRFTADSDAIITKGIIGLLIRVMNEQTPADVATADLFFIQEIGLQEHLSPTRSNGLVGMIKKLKISALQALNS